MSDILKGLTEEQKNVVTTIDGPVLVVAGAGSGKTTVLVRRVAWMIEHGVEPENILLLTFTRASATSMLNRAKTFTPKAAGVMGGTFHSVANTILREIHDVFGLPKHFSILDPQDAGDALKVCMAEVSFPGEIAPKAGSIANMFSYENNTRCGLPEAIEKKLKEWRDYPAWFELLRKQYVRYKIEHAMLDYDDLLIYLNEALKDKDISAQIRARWPYVMVDEHQDSNSLQLEIIYNLGGVIPNVMAVGDPAQAIYGFRGSAPATMFDFKNRWRSCKVFLLQTNFRSTKPILDLVNRVDRSMKPRFDRKLVPHSDMPASTPSIIKCQDETAQSKEICRRVLVYREEGIDLDHQVVLVRSMWSARHLETELISRKIPYVVVGGLKIDEAAHVKDVLSVARIAVNHKNEMAWIRSLTLLDGIGQVAAKKIVDNIKHNIDCGFDFLNSFQMNVWPKRANIKPLYAALDAALSEDDTETKLSRISKSLEPILKLKYPDDWNDRKKDLEMIGSLASDSPDLSAFLAKVTLDYSLDKKQNEKDKDGLPPLTISTVHSAKGLEWDVVHIPSFVQNHFPSQFAVQPDDRAEELRVFYVAVSRAKKHLHIYKPTVDEKGGIKTESYFENYIRPCVTYLTATSTGRQQKGWFTPPKAKINMLERGR